MGKCGLWVCCAAWVVIVAACDKSSKNATGSGNATASASGSASGSAAGTASGSASGSAAGIASASAAGSASGTAAAMVPPAAAVKVGFQVGDPVYGLWEGNDQWYPGKIAAINADGTYKIKYSDGDVSAHLSAKRVKARTVSPSSGHHGGGVGGGCHADLMNDPKNCGSCGRECPEACMSGSCVSNSYKYGE